MSVSAWAALVSGMGLLYAVFLFFGGALASRGETQVVSLGVAGLTGAHLAVAWVAGPTVDAAALLAYLLAVGYWVNTRREAAARGAPG